MTTSPDPAGPPAPSGPHSDGQAPPSKSDIRLWRRYLADEHAEAATTPGDLARRRDGEEREILLALAEAEGRHEKHWRDLLDGHGDQRLRPSFRRTVLRFLARRFGSVFVLALAQRAESRSPTRPNPRPPRPWPPTS